MDFISLTVYWKAIIIKRRFSLGLVKIIVQCQYKTVELKCMPQIGRV